jgi:hypothetical protein
MSMTAAAAKRLDIGRVLQDGLGALTRNVVPFAILALLLQGVPQALIDFGQLFPPNRVGYFLFLGLGMVIDLVTGPMLVGALVYGTIRDLEGRHVSMAQCLAVGSKYWFRLLGLGLLEVLAVAVGLLLVVVPGVLLILRWSVAASAVVMEDRGIQEAMGRSASLTEFRRWPIFLLALIYLVLAVVLSLALTALIQGPLDIRAHPWLGVALSSIFATTTTLVQITVAAALFRHLRGDPEGGPTEALAEVFA